MFLYITFLQTYQSNNTICPLPSGLHLIPELLTPVPLSCRLLCPPFFFFFFFLSLDDTGSPCSNFTLSSWHPLKWRWALGPCWPDSTLALGPLNNNKDRLWIIDTNTTNEETLSQLFCWHTNTHTQMLTEQLASTTILITNIVPAASATFSKTNIFCTQSISCRRNVCLRGLSKEPEAKILLLTCLFLCT